MHGEREVKVIAYALIIAGLVCLAGILLSGGCGHSSSPTRGNSLSTAQQAQRAAEFNQQAGAAVKSAAGAVRRAEQHADRAEQLNNSAQAGISDCQKLVSDIRADNQRAKQIIDELVAGAQAGAAQDEAH